MPSDSRRLPVALGLLLAAAGVCAALTARSAPPDTSAATAATAAPTISASPAPLTSTSASASATATLTGRAAWPRLRGADIPTERSDSPRGKEWESGKKIRPNRDANLAGPCDFVLVREWLRIECGRLGATLFAGEPADVKILPSGKPLFTADSDLPQPSMTITLRLERGQTRMFQFLAVWDVGYGGVGLGDDETLSVVWREGREDPLILFGHI